MERLYEIAGMLLMFFGAIGVLIMGRHGITTERQFDEVFMYVVVMTIGGFYVNVGKLAARLKRIEDGQR